MDHAAVGLVNSKRLRVLLDRADVGVRPRRRVWDFLEFEFEFEGVFGV